MEIAIEQFALIDRVRLQFGPGLNVLTGETGAGKSIILDALAASLGGRTPADVVRAGEERAVIEAVLDLSGQPDRVRAALDLGIDIAEDGLLVIHREVARQGRGRILLNGRSVTGAMLRQVGEGAADLHGQHEHQSLLQPHRHLELLDQYGGMLLRSQGHALEVLDRYGGDPLLALRERVAEVHARLQALRAERASLAGDARERARRLDLLHYQKEELDRARLRPGEEEEVEAELRVLAAAGRLRAAAEEAYALLYEGTRGQESAADLLGRVLGLVDEMARTDPAAGAARELLEAASVHVREASRFLADYRERVEDDPARQAALERRLEELAALRRKYGNTVEEMLRYREEVAAEIERLGAAEARAARLDQEIAALGREAEELASRLSEARREAAAALSAQVAREVADLGMPHARFEVAVEPPARRSWEEVGPRGWDRVEFLFSPNPGEPLRPLAKIVSGGEMSRIMLALKVILARVDGVPTLVFDEVDTGLSGRTAQAVAEKLARIAQSRQVLCVTHLPQVAAMADVHFAIRKETDGDRTVTRVERLDEEGRVQEIARMIGGAEVTRLTLENARELIRSAAAWRQALGRGNTSDLAGR
ncbi:DNA repair protein RecN [Caldinitratiruptor microaerophilus]|uniref:DNA repair protein RecN n=1 Tax=Caldinitratiruptor microaerophilus TaxID=671077 RepID=UPI00222E760D|nr:DNA repair protein RecN [Caldinitratiruptor microaerophilus]